jgi:hypothetical protein
MLHLALTLCAAFVPSPLRGSGHLAVASSPARSLPLVAIGNFKMPEMPSFGGGGDDFKLFPSDVQFTDVDGDTVTIRPLGASKIDFYVNGKLRLSKAVLAKNGNMLEITGTITKGTPFSIIGFNLEDVITEGTQPRDPADCDKAVAAAA